MFPVFPSARLSSCVSALPDIAEISPSNLFRYLFPLRLRRVSALVVCLLVVSSLALCTAGWAQTASNPAPVNFGSQAVGTAQTQTTVTFTVTAGGTMGTPLVLTKGAPNQDYTLGTGSTCTGSVTGSTCTVNVVFTPKAPGQRLGAVELTNSSGTQITTALLYGTGTGPLVTFPGSTALGAVGSGFSEPHGVAVDGNGDVFVGDEEAKAVFEIVAVNGVVTSSSVVNQVGSGFNAPQGVAVDGSGNVFVADSAIKEIVAVNGTVNSNSAVNVIGSGFDDAEGVAVDGSGNVFVADTFNSAVKEIVAVNGVVSSSSTVNVVGSGANYPAGVAVDGNGDVFVANPTNDDVNGFVSEIVAVNGVVTSSSVVNTVGSGFAGPFGVAVDGSGNVFVNDVGDSPRLVKEIVAVNGAVSSTSTVNVVGSGFNLPYGVAVDGAGHVFVADFGKSTVDEIDLTTAPPQAFASTTVGATSSDSPRSVAVQNAGNAPLDFSSLATNSTNYPVSSTQTCSTSSPLPESGVCTVAASFTPQSVGAPSGIYTLTDNSLNVAGTMQTISLNGTGTENLVFTTPPPASLNAGQNAGTVVLSVNDSSGVDTSQTSSITLTVSGPGSYSRSYTQTAVSGVVSFNTSSSALTAAGTYTYTAAAPNLISPTPVSETVVALAAVAFTVVPANTLEAVGYADNITVDAVDQYGNVATTYAGTVALTSSDLAATLPGNFTLSSGTATEPVTFATQGSQTVTATDTINSALKGASVAITVQFIPVYTINSSTGASDTSAACTNQALAGSAAGATTDSDCNIYAAFAAVTALNNTAMASYAPTINFVNGFASTLSSGTLTLATAIPVTGNFILAGPGPGANAITLSGGGSVNFLTQSSANSNMTLSGLTFTSFILTGSNPVSGSVLRGGGSPGVVTFSNDVFSSDGGTGSSGGVFYGNNLTVTGSTFTGNKGNTGGALYLLGGTNSISNSTFTSNTASGSDGGGAIFVGGGTLTLSGNTYTSNAATLGNANGYGGAVYGTGTAITEAGSTYTSNSSTNYGGAIYTSLSTGATLNIANSTFNTNHTVGAGGAVYAGGTLTITTGTTFTGNYVLDTLGTAYGGAVADSATAGTKTISGVSFINNYAKGTTAEGGALYLTTTPTVTNSLFSGNYVSATTTAEGGGAYGGGTYTGVTFYGNYTTGTATTQDGGAFYRTGTVTMYNVTMTGNSAKIGGGSYGLLTAYNTVISGNTATGSYKDAEGATASTAYNYVNTGSATTCTQSSTTYCTPLLSALGNYGGLTQTMVPLPGSPLLAAGSLSYVGSPGTLSGGATTDGRGTGYPRTLTEAGSSHVDIGAAEANYSLSFVMQPASTAVNAALLPPPTVQIYESGVAFGGAGGTLAVAAESGSMFTTSADSTEYTSVATTASGLESIAPYFSAPQADDSLVVSVVSGATTPVTVASTTSGAFNIGDTSAASIAFAKPPAPTVATGGNAGVVTVALTNANGTTTTTATGAVTLAVTGPSSYSQTYGPTAAVNGAVSFNLSGVALTTAGGYTYTASAAAYTTDTVVAPETVGGDNVWVLDASGSLVKLTSAGALSTTVSNPNGGTASYGGVAFDFAGDVYSVNSASNTLLFSTNTGGSMATYNGAGLNAPTSIAIDGAGYIWVANSGNNTVSEFTDGRVTQSGTLGYGSSYVTGNTLSAPSAIVIDNTGGVWVANKSGNSVSHIFGAATPVVTPLASATTNGTLGSKP